jgi:hypothetical protein
MEESGTSDSRDVRGSTQEDAPVQGAGPRYPTLDREYRGEAASFATEMDLKSVSEILEGSGLRPIFSADCGEGEAAGGGLHSDDSESGEEPNVDLPPIRFFGFLGSGKTAVTIGTDGEAQINLQVHPQFLEQIIELLRRRNNVLDITIL